MVFTTDPLSDGFYTASLLFRAVRNGQPLATDLWEESIVLVTAPTLRAATDRAAALGAERSVCYRSAEGDQVAWQFVKVESVFGLEDGALGHGTELFSRHRRNAEVERLLTPFKDG